MSPSNEVDSFAVGAEESLVRWRKFSEYCHDGYPWELEDYLSDVALRSVIKVALKDDEIRASGGWGDVESEIGRIDSQLKGLFRIEGFPRSAPVDEWWIRNVPIYAARSLCRELEEAYGVRISSRSRFDADLDSLEEMKSRGIDLVDALIEARDRGWYIATEPALLFRAFKFMLSLDRKGRKVVWDWARGEVTDPFLQAALKS